MTFSLNTVTLLHYLSKILQKPMLLVWRPLLKCQSSEFTCHITARVTQGQAIRSTHILVIIGSELYTKGLLHCLCTGATEHINVPCYWYLSCPVGPLLWFLSGCFHCYCSSWSDDWFYWLSLMLLQSLSTDFASTGKWYLIRPSLLQIESVILLPRLQRFCYS